MLQRTVCFSHSMTICRQHSLLTRKRRAWGRLTPVITGKDISGITGRSGLVEVSPIESALDLQFEVFTAHLNDGERLPQRSAINNAQTYLEAPYGIYATADGCLALAMSSVTQLGELLECEALLAYTDPATWFSARDEIKAVIALHLATRSTAYWIERLEAADYWCAEVLDWNRLTAHPAFAALQMVQNAGFRTTYRARDAHFQRCHRYDSRCNQSARNVVWV